MKKESSQNLTWDQIVDNLNLKIFRESIIDFSVAKMGWFSPSGVLSTVVASPSILDYGSNSGIMGINLAKRLKASKLTQADLRDERYISDIPFIQVERDQAPQTDQQFDVIFLADVLQYVSEENRLPLLTKLISKLGSQGKVIVQTYNNLHSEQMQAWWESNRISEDKIAFLTAPEIFKPSPIAEFVVKRITR